MSLLPLTIVVIWDMEFSGNLEGGHNSLGNYGYILRQIASLERRWGTELGNKFRDQDMGHSKGPFLNS